MSVQGFTEVGEDENGTLFGVLTNGMTDQKLSDSLKASETGGSSTQRRNKDDIGPIRRGRGGVFGAIDYRTFALRNSELATAIMRSTDELFRTQFPHYTPEFQVRCTECGTEFESQLEQCEECGSTELRTPDRKALSEFKDFFKSINKEGTSLYEMAKFQQHIQSFYGVSVLVNRMEYVERQREVKVGGRTVRRVKKHVPVNTKELRHAHPYNVVPVIDENGVRGGWYTCPKHRGDTIYEKDDVDIDDGEILTVCEDCGSQLKEVHFVEAGDNNASKNQHEEYYFNEEVIQWSVFHQKQPGIDGWSPVRSLIKDQVILEFSKNYNISYLDPENNDLPNKLLLIFTSDPESLRTQLTAAEQESAQNPKDVGQMVQEISGEDDGSRVETLDLTPSEVLTNRERTLDRMESKVRSMFGIPDAFDNEFGQTSGLSAEGEQLEINNRWVSAKAKDWKHQCLDKLKRVVRIGGVDSSGEPQVTTLDDWSIGFVDPERERMQMTGDQIVNSIRTAKESQVPYKVEDGQFKPVDHEWDPSEESEDDIEDNTQ